MVAREVSQASGFSEPDSALLMAYAIKAAHQKSSGSVKAYDIREFVAALCISGITSPATEHPPLPELGD